MDGVMVMVMMLATSPGEGASGASEAAEPARRVYTHLLDPREHPDYTRRYVQPPSWETFGNRTRFTALRGFSVTDNRITGYTEELDRYTRTHALGDIIWPSYPILFADNLDELVDEIARRDLFLFDIWGYVPGSGPGGYWQQFKPPSGVLDMIAGKLGERWLGMDVGEQDGRYIGGYAGQMHPISQDRVEQYLNFHRHFQRMTDELGNRMATLVSLNFGHHLIKEGVYTTIGAETAQALPNGQVYYAFIRGAGKQYGVPWFGNASVWNRWGYKTYGSEGNDHGPTHGTSLNLLKRLIYHHILYNCVFVGFESSWFDGEELSPVGRIQQAARQWTRDVGQPGVMLTPIALMTDFFSGWSFPRHLYTGHTYRVWGNLPYGPGDHLMDGALEMLYPGYQDASYFHDERGFIAPTPFGDSADCLLSDAPAWLLDRYAVLVLAGELDGSCELRDKLLGYVQRGGRLVLTAGNLARFPGGLAGIAVSGSPRHLPAGTELCCGDTTQVEPNAFELLPLTLPDTARVTIRCDGQPAVVEVPYGAGTVLVSATPYGVGAVPAAPEGIPNQVDTELPQPYPLLLQMQSLLAAEFRAQMLFDAGPDLSLVVCRRGEGDYILGVTNNGLEARPLTVVSRCGPIERLEELKLDTSEVGAAGHLPRGSEQADIGTSDDTTIAGGDIRIFAVRVQENGVEQIAHAAPPTRPRGRILPLRGVNSVQEELLRRPTFFQHYDGVIVDWRYLHSRDRQTLEAEGAWLDRQGVHLLVDLTSGLNLYPDLRLVNNDPEEFDRSMAVFSEVLAKMPAFGARDLVLSLHRTPENNFSWEQTRQSFVTTLRELCHQAATADIRLHLRISAKAMSEPKAMIQLVTDVEAANLRLVPSLALLLHQQTEPAALPSELAQLVDLWGVAAPACDISGALYSLNAPLATYPDAAARLAPFTQVAPEAALILDSVPRNWNEEYAEAQVLNAITRQ